MRKKDYLYIKKIDNRQLKRFKKIIQRRKSKRLESGFLEKIVVMQKQRIKSLYRLYREGK